MFTQYVLISHTDVNPPMPLPSRTPTLYGQVSKSTVIKCLHTSIQGKLCKSVQSLCFSFLIYSDGSKSLTSPTNLTSGTSSLSNKVISSIPQTPFLHSRIFRLHYFPMDKSHPIPVITTLSLILTSVCTLCSLNNHSSIYT